MAVGAHNSAADQYSVWRTFKLYCTSCHFGPRAPAGLDLQALDERKLDENGATWEKLLRKLRNREMPPAGLPRPDEAGYEALIQYIEGERDRRRETVDLFLKLGALPVEQSGVVIFVRRATD